MRRYTLRNDFHDTSCNVICDGLSHIHGECEIQLSKGQADRARRELCGQSDCTCSGEIGTRGPQRTDDGKRLIVLPHWA